MNIGTNDLSIDFWWKPSTTSNSRQNLFSILPADEQLHESQHRGIHIYAAGNTNNVGSIEIDWKNTEDTNIIASHISGANETLVNTPRSNNVFYHIALIRKTTKLYFFVNGDEIRDYPIFWLTQNNNARLNKFDNLTNDVGINTLNANLRIHMSHDSFFDHLRIYSGDDLPLDPLNFVIPTSALTTIPWVVINRNLLRSIA